jgi:fibronectin type 3 domain-containing protein
MIRMTSWNSVLSWFTRVPYERNASLCTTRSTAAPQWVQRRHRSSAFESDSRISQSFLTCFRTISSLVLFIVVISVAGSEAIAAGPFGVNGDWDFVNVTNQITGWSPPSGSSSVPPLDNNGWPMGDASAVMFDERRNMPWRGPDSAAVDENISGTYLLSMTGQAVITGSTEVASGVTIENQQYDSSTNTTTAQVVYAPFHWLMQLNFSNTVRSPGDATGTGFTNLVLLRPGYPAGSTQVFTNGTLQAYANNFACNRFLGPDATNSYQNFFGTNLITTTWDTRVQVTDAYQGGLPQNQTNGNQAWGDAWEYMIMLSNQTNTDMWINIPASVDDNYVTQLATLILHGDQYTPGLNPGLHVYVEYSDEVWNFGFQQATYNQIQAQADGLTDDEQYLQRTYQIAQLFEGVFGSGSLNNTVRPVALWQYTTEMGFFNTLAWGEANLGAPVKTWLWGVGEAPYYNPTDISSVNNIFNTMWTGSDSTRVDFIGWQAVATYYGIHEVGYESGPSLSAEYGSPATHSTKMVASEMHHFLSNWFATGGDLVEFFALRGDVSEFGDWLLVEDYEDLNTPKMVGAQKILAAAQPAITAGYVLPWKVGTSASIDPSQSVPNPFSSQSVPLSGLTLSNNGAVYAYLLRAPDTGTYSISLYGYAQSGAQVQVKVDDSLVGTLTLPASLGSSPTLPVTLTAGFHGLVLLATGSGSTTLPARTGNIAVTLTSGGGKGVVPSSPMNLTSTVSNDSATLIWAQQSTATSYNVERSVTSGGPYTLVENTTSNTYTDTTVTNGTTYYYVVSAKNAYGAGGLSPQIPVTPAPGPPAPPASLTANSAGGDATPFYPGGVVLLTWPAVPNAITYNIMRGTSSGGPYSLVVNQIATNYADRNTTNGTPYYYVVTAENSLGQSGSSPQAAVTPNEVVPAAPTGLTSDVTTSVLLRWSANPGTDPEFETAFNVMRGTQSGGPYTLIASLNTFSLNDTTVVSGTTYYYVVAQTNAAGTGPNSAELKVVVPE